MFCREEGPPKILATCLAALHVAARAAARGHRFPAATSWQPLLSPHAEGQLGGGRQQGGRCQSGGGQRRTVARSI